MPPTVLIAEDEKIVRDFLVYTVSALGYHVAAVCDGNSALELLANQPFQVLLTDLRMPGLDGLQLIRAALKIYPDLCCILHSSGSVDRSDLPPGVLLLEKTSEKAKIAAALLTALSPL